MAAAEHDITRALVRLVSNLGDEDRLGFLRKALGVSAVPGDGAVSSEIQPSAPYDLEGERIVVLGVAPTAEVSWATDSGSSIPDAVFSQYGRLIVVVELAVSGTLDGWQLLRHAGTWGAPVAHEQWDEDGPPRGIGIVSWAHVVRWLREEHGEASASVELLARLAELGLEEAAPDPPERTPAITRGEEPPAANLNDFFNGVSPRAVRGAIDRLYGPKGSLHVSASSRDTKRDAQAVGKRFEQAGEPVPGRLFDEGPGGVGDVITPARALSMLAGPRQMARRHLITPNWPEIRDRLVFRGADRGVALAMWAYADELSGPDQRRLQSHAGRVWTVAPPNSLATPELTQALGELGLTPA